ncbi:mitochondrial inner membrane protease ATP23 homolog [Macrosteles quadrilineatus]|uniref:mitochondrial inner membrane protease ATP23 homolog n=1 Tax=Macrosteles quadrilineatus TaxID=74068 RepID=UPI0023E32114|nr:mitochondrial inner membrane protease ATP23 homolog [Macrosteles quadrilineatus]XP_054257878.1 mitochondrial inner membrane protease ATP23 homolog [Macrosteles quadrilineatus]
MTENKEPELQRPTDDEIREKQKWGYDLYPERKGGFKASLSQMMFGEGRLAQEKTHCEINVYNCFLRSKLVKLMVGALKSSGCDVDLRRHFACEWCGPEVNGGYDPLTNQVVICQNRTRSEKMVQGVLTHEMIHMFDYCRHKLDFRNLEHLACTEIRAANLTHCGFISAMIQGDASPFNIRAQHQECVKSKAMWSVMVARNVGMDEAKKVVDKVFPHCYNDLEPIGRRCKTRSADMSYAYSDGYFYGYVDIDS